MINGILNNLKDLRDRYKAASTPLSDQEEDAACSGITILEILGDAPIVIGGVEIDNVNDAMSRMWDRLQFLEGQQKGSGEDRPKGDAQDANPMTPENRKRIQDAIDVATKAFEEEQGTSKFTEKQGEQLSERVRLAINALGIEGLVARHVSTVQKDEDETEESALERLNNLHRSIHGTHTTGRLPPAKEPESLTAGEFDAAMRDLITPYFAARGRRVAKVEIYSLPDGDETPNLDTFMLDLTSGIDKLPKAEKPVDIE